MTAPSRGGRLAGFVIDPASREADLPTPADVRAGPSGA